MWTSTVPCLCQWRIKNTDKQSWLWCCVWYCGVKLLFTKNKHLHASKLNWSTERATKKKLKLKNNKTKANLNTIHVNAANLTNWTDDSADSTKCGVQMVWTLNVYEWTITGGFVWMCMCIWFPRRSVKLYYTWYVFIYRWLFKKNH